MHRGYFDFLNNHSGYTDSSKDWFVDVSQTKIYWYDLVINPPEEIDIRRFITEQLKALRRSVEESLEKRFIYFICSRKKVRFDTRNPPSYKWFSDQLRIPLLLGSEKQKITVSITFSDIENGKTARPKVNVTDRFITLFDSAGNGSTLSVHDFLMNFDINIGQSTTVHYVGYTKSPDTRPTNGNHGGLGETIYKMPTSENDIFVVFNLFKVMTKASNSSHMLDFLVANSMIDEITAELEGKLIEKCFISYFNSSLQWKNKIGEQQELNNNLTRIAKKNKINSIQIHYEVSGNSEYWNFQSTHIPPSARHLFTVETRDDTVHISPGSAIHAEIHREFSPPI